MGKNTSGELSSKCVISTEAPQMLPVLVVFGGRASFGVLIQMTSTINLCKGFFFFIPPREQAILATASCWGEERDVGSFEGTQLKARVILPAFPSAPQQQEHINCVS